jgi:hypothetical protein
VRPGVVSARAEPHFNIGHPRHFAPSISWVRFEGAWPRAREPIWASATHRRPKGLGEDTEMTWKVLSMANPRHSGIHGHVSKGFEAVRHAFVENFSRRRELGAACCMYRQGEKVVDLWGGIRNEASGEPWQEDTMVIVHSATAVSKLSSIAHRWPSTATSVSIDVPAGHQVVKKARSPSAMRRRISRPRVHKPSFAVLNGSASRSANSR